MSASDIYSRTKEGLFWSTGLKMIFEVFRFGISIVIARILDPLDFGIMAIGAMVIYYSNSPLFGVAKDATDVTVVASYPQAGQLLSGYAIHPEFMAGKAALVESSYGEGSVILFGFRPHYRGQSHETFKILFNAVYQSAAGPQGQES